MEILATTLISVENFEDGNVTREINSPRSLESCLRSGLDPSELHPKPFDRLGSKHLPQEMIDIKHDYFEKKRREKIMIVKSERNSIIQFSDRHSQMTNTMSPQEILNKKALTLRESCMKESSLIEMEERRIEVLKKRQEKELAKVVEREKIMATSLMKMKKIEDDDFERKKSHDRKVAIQRVLATKKEIARMHEIDRLDKEEIERKKELARKDQEFDEKMKLLAIDAEKKLTREIRLRDDERNTRMEEARKRTEALIQSQVEEVEAYRLKASTREARVLNQLKVKRETKQEEGRHEKEKAAKRIAEALDRRHVLLEERKALFIERLRQASMRAGEVLADDRIKAKAQEDDRDKRLKQRLHRLLDAHKTRSCRRQEIVKKRCEKDKTYDKIQEERNAHNAMLKFASDMKINEKVENVERVARMGEFHRLQTLKRIESADDRYNKIQQQKHEILRKHNDDTKYNLLRKHEISDTMGRMLIENNFTLLDKLLCNKGGHRGSTVSYNGNHAGDMDDDRILHTA